MPRYDVTGSVFLYVPTAARAVGIGIRVIGGYLDIEASNLIEFEVADPVRSSLITCPSSANQQAFISYNLLRKNIIKINKLVAEK